MRTSIAVSTTRVVELATANLAALPPDWVHEFLGNAHRPRSTIAPG